jgi:hypothetical protein
VLRADPDLPAFEEVAGLSADHVELDAGFALLGDEAARRADDVGVEGAAEALVGGDHDQQRAAAAAVLQQRVRLGVGTRGEGVEDLHHLARVRPGREHRFLGAAELGRGDHLHRLGDLLRALDAADPSPDVGQGGHRLLPRSPPRPWP